MPFFFLTEKNTCKQTSKQKKGSFSAREEANLLAGKTQSGQENSLDNTNEHKASEVLW